MSRTEPIAADLDDLEAWVKALGSRDPQVIARTASAIVERLHPAERTGAADQAAWMAATPIPADRATTFDMREVAAAELLPGDVLHYADAPIDVVDVREPIIPVVIGVDGREHVVHCPASQLVLASRPSGWPEPGEAASPAPLAITARSAADLLPVTPSGGPSRAEVLAGIRRPHHDQTPEADDA